ncbi:hypothetical protein ABKV19_012323 [Rosa sericea]
MAYVDHPFSITDVIVVGTLMAYNRVGGEKAHGTLISFYCHNGDAAKQYTQKQIEILRTKSHWKKDYFYLWDERNVFAILGGILFIPGSITHGLLSYAYKRYKGFSFPNIPPM